MFLFVLVVGISCSHESVQTLDACDTTIDPVAADDASLGFTSADVLGLVQANLPTSVVWDELTPGAERASAEMVIDGIEGDIGIAYEGANVGSCRDEPGLRVPLGVTFTLDDGDLVAAGTLVVDATALEIDSVYLFSDLQELPVEVAGDYASDLETYHAAGNHSGDPIIGTNMYGVGTWAEGDLGIEAQYPDAVEGIWRGYWVIPTE